MIDLFSGLDEAKVGGNFMYPQEGRYTLEIEAVKTGTTRKGKTFFAADLKVITTTSEFFQPGGVMNWMVML